MKSKSLILVVLTTIILLFIPLIAMQFTDEVYWTLSDFVIGGVLLLGTGLMLVLVLRKVKRSSHKIVICVALLLALFLIWSELAVGIFGTPFGGQ